MELTLAKALIYKKRVEAEIIRRKDAATKNANITEIEKPSLEDVQALIAESNRLNTSWLEVKKHMVDVKVVLFNASAPIRAKILNLAELKDVAAFFNGLNTARNEKAKITQNQGYHDKITYTVSIYTMDERNIRVKQTQDQIDTIQAEIEAFNHRTMVTIPDFVL